MAIPLNRPQRLTKPANSDKPKDPLRKKRQWYEDPGVELTDRRPPALSDLTTEEKSSLRAQHKERIAKVMDLYFRGWSSYKIGAELDIPASVIQKDVVRYLNRLADQYETMKSSYRQLQLARYNRMLATWWPIAEMAYDPNAPVGRRVKPDHIKAAARAQDVVNRIMTDINKLLELGTYGDSKPRPMQGPIQFNFFDGALVGKAADGKLIVTKEDGTVPQADPRQLPQPSDLGDLTFDAMAELLADEVIDDAD